MRKPHYWKVCKRTETPSEIIVVDTETFYGKDTLTPFGEWHTLRLGCAIAYRYEKGKRTRQHRLTFYKSSEFWDFVRSRMSRARPVWIIGHNLPYDLGVLGGWKVICGDDYHAKKLCISGQMFYVKGHIDGCGLNFLDTVNYYHCSLAKIGKSVGMPKMEMPSNDAPLGAWEVYCMNDVEVTAKGLEALIDFHHANGLGPWQPSIASNAFAAYRSRFMNTQVLVHCNWKALRLERDAYCGGIVETAYVGTVPEQYIYELDVCSMYPSVCREELPARFLGYSEKMGVKHIQKIREKFLVFADVEISNSDTQYPYKGKRGTYYPTGSFRTALAHPELMDAIDRGVVRYVHRCSWYTKAPLFNRYMEYFVGHKIRYEREGNDAFAYVCKLFATNLYGKTGQVTPKWLEWGKEALQTLEQKYGVDEGALAYWYNKPPDVYHNDAGIKLPELPIAIDSRSDYGKLEIRIGENESRDSCPAIAACVTSYARLLLRKYQKCVGVGNWYYSDTDSIWVNGRGLHSLIQSGYLARQQLGYLDYKDIHFFMDIHGPKDYQTDLVCKMKGIRANHSRTDDGGYCQLQFPGALAQIREGTDDGVMVKPIVKHLYREITKCVVMSDGHTRPLVFPLENPERELGKRKRAYTKADKRINPIRSDCATA